MKNSIIYFLTLFMFLLAQSGCNSGGGSDDKDEGDLTTTGGSGGFGNTKTNDNDDVVYVGIEHNEDFITYNGLIDEIDANFCPYWGNEVCNFDGGQAVQFADKTVHLQLFFTYKFFSNLTDSPDFNSDIDSISMSLWVPSPDNGGPESVVGKITKIARAPDGEYRWVCIIIDTQTFDAYLVHDTLDNGCQSGSEFLSDITISEW
jgi:hypothetical protein